MAERSASAAIDAISLTPEFCLAAACCRQTAAARREPVRSAAARTIDWNRFLRVVRRQRIAGLVNAALLDAGIAVPSPVARELASQAHQIARHTLALAAETARLQSLLQAGGIRSLAVKGAALAQLAYNTVATKHGRDIDLLVLPDDATAAMTLLEREGYALRLPFTQLNPRQREAVVRYSNEVEFHRARDNVHVELHWRLTQNPQLLRGIDARSPAQEVALPGGLRLRTLADAELFAYLSAHGAVHAWSRLKWLADVNAFLAGKSNEDIGRFYRRAQECGAGRCAELALLLCHALFDSPLPEDMEAKLGNDARVARLARGCIDLMSGGDDARELHDRPFGTARVLLMQFRLSREWRYFIAQCRFWSIGLPDVVLLPLPAGGAFLYPLLRLPLFVLRRLRAFGEPRRSGRADARA